jgi:hypothetical protein
MHLAGCVFETPEIDEGRADKMEEDKIKFFLIEQST